MPLRSYPNFKLVMIPYRKDLRGTLGHGLRINPSLVTSCSLVTSWVYQILAGEVKNSEKVMLLSFNRTDVFLYDVMVSENDVLDTRN